MSVDRAVPERAVLDEADAERGLGRMVSEIVERHRGTEGLLLVGVARGGVPVARRLARLLAERGGPVPVGSVDITLYRDDAATALPNPRIGTTSLPISIEGRRVILCDDVLYTGRTTRAAVDALLDYGRPAKVELAVLVDRGGRELPIQADYRGVTVEVGPGERIDVLSAASGGTDRFRAVVVPLGSPSTPPPAASPPPVQ